MAEPARQTPPSNHGPPTLDGQAVTDTVQQGWYQSEVTDIGGDERELLERYSGIAPLDILPHVLRLRDKAFRVWSYACIGQMRFLAFNLRRLPFYERVRERLRHGATFCDAGCCFGQELRHLAFYDRIPPTQLYGFDIEQGFVDMGYELFRDQESFGAHFAVSDVLDPKDGRLRPWQGKIDVVFCSSFLHVFDWDAMVSAGKQLVMLTRPGGMICGKQLGSLKAGTYQMPTATGSHYRHDAASMRRMWEQIGRETSLTWRVEAELYEGLWELAANQKHSWSDPNQRMLWWIATRES